MMLIIRGDAKMSNEEGWRTSGDVEPGKLQAGKSCSPYLDIQIACAMATAPYFLWPRVQQVMTLVRQNMDINLAIFP